MIEERAFAKLRTIVQRETGIALRGDKRELLANRLSKRLRALGLQSENEYLRILETEAEPAELLELIDAVSTNVTHFFREEEHFRVLQRLLEQQREQREIRIWCAAAATGEEPYTIAMVADQVLPRAREQCRILATDICLRALRRASDGLYTAKQVERVPRHLLARYFTKQHLAGAHQYAVSPELRGMILFKRMNLSRFPYPLRGPFDVIFCRNVMIYFDLELRRKMTESFEQLLKRGGHLFIGHSENLLGIRHATSSPQASIFCK